jgi:Fe2+ or Zn2+ uptake regulation protein
LSKKKQYIVAQVLKLQHDSGIDALIVHIRSAGIKVSHSSIYSVLQWLVAKNLVIKTVQGHAKTVLYKANRTELNKRQYTREDIYAFRLPSGHALQGQEAILLIR